MAESGGRPAQGFSRPGFQVRVGSREQSKWETRSLKLRIDAFALSAATLGELVMQFQQECVRAVDAIGEDDKPETRKHCELMDVVRRPFKPASFEPFCEQAGSLAIVPNDLDQITTVRFIMHPSIKFRATGRLYRIDNLHKTWGVDRRHPAPLDGFRG